MKKFFNISFVILLSAINVRGSLGYLFRFGDPNSSPTYSERPYFFFILWDVIIVLLTYVIVLNFRKIFIKYWSYYFILIIFLLISSLQVNEFYVLGAIRSFILCGLVFCILVSSSSWIELSYINKTIEILSYIGLIFLLFQLYQYKWFGILPAHSHAGGLVRFGSFYDDSLVLGIFMPMFTGYFVRKFHRKNYHLIIISMVSLFITFLTGSLTAIVAMAIYLVWIFRRKASILAITIIGLVLSAILYSEKIYSIWIFKSGSIKAHLEGFQYLKELTFITLMGFNPLNVFVETGFLSILYNFGFPVLAIFSIFHVATFYKCNRVFKFASYNTDLRLFAGATEGLTVSVLLANLNLSPFVYPPIYLMVSIFSGIILAINIPAIGYGNVQIENTKAISR